MNKRDGHIHSHYCPHGSKDTFYQYIEKALQVGLSEITFTEHMPLPKVKYSENRLKESSPSKEEIIKFFKEANKVKEEYKEKIKINVGLEVDYIEGYENEIKDLLMEYGEYIDDSILSVHFLNYNGEILLLDYSTKDFKEIIEKVHGIENLYNLYYKTLIKSVNADLGNFKPKRIGHPTLIRIFNKEFPYEYNEKTFINKFLEEVRNKGYELDYNTAGLRKQFCLETYPSGYLLEKAKELSIKFVYGSDSHKAEDVGKDFNKNLI